MCAIVAAEDMLLNGSVKPCFRNSEEDFKYLLHLYRGKSQKVMGDKNFTISEAGKYQEELDSVITSIRMNLNGMSHETDCLTCSGSKRVLGV